MVWIIFIHRMIERAREISYSKKSPVEFLGRTGALLLWIVYIFFAFPKPVQAVIDIDIYGPSIPKFPISVPFFKNLGSKRASQGLSSEVPAILSNDLRLSGFFDIIDPSDFLGDLDADGLKASTIDFEAWRLVGADLLVKGSFSLKGNKLTIEASLLDVSQGKMVFGKSYSGPLKSLRIMVHRFADEIIRQLTGERGIFTTKIAFISAVRGNKELFIMDVDGENVVQLSRYRSITLSPRWSPNGLEIAFISYSKRNANLYSLPLKSLRRRLISGRKNMNGPASWSPNGKKMATTLTIHGNPEIYIIDRKGKILNRVTNHVAIDVSPKWSPDGLTIVFVSNRSGNPQIYTVSTDGGQAKRITFEGDYNTSPAWSPKGDRIAFSSLIDGRYQICTVKPDGSDLRQLTFDSVNSEDPTWSPDGRYIAYTYKERGSSNIYMMMANGTNQMKITRHSGKHILPNWSPWIE